MSKDTLSQALQPKQELTFPFMQIAALDGGILITIVRSAFEKSEVLIPAQNADAMAIQWLVNRPDAVLFALAQARKAKRDEAALIGHVMAKREPVGV